MGDLDLYQRNDALPHSYTLKRDEPDNSQSSNCYSQPCNFHHRKASMSR